MNDLLFPLRLSFQVAGVATFFVVIVGVIIGYLLAMKRFYGKDALDVVLTLPLVLPPTVTGYYLVILLGRRGLLGSYLYDCFGWSLMFTWQAAVTASFVVSLPLMIKTARAAMEAVDRNLINVSYTLGHSELSTALRVILPLSKKGLIAGAILAFARGLGEFGATLMIAGNIPGKTSTVPLTIYSLTASGDRQKANLLVLLFTALSALFLFAANRLTKRTI
ncbi:MAG: molybdate ABC transporter permease subunit [Syntrophobacteraceae bacterium]